jgi:hypothetical protein
MLTIRQYCGRIHGKIGTRSRLENWFMGDTQGDGEERG